MKRMLNRNDLDNDILSSLSLNALLAEEINKSDKNTIVEVNYKSLHCSYYNNADHVAYPYYKDIIIPDCD